MTFEGGPLVAGNLEELQQFTHAGGVVHALAHLRENLFTRKHVKFRLAEIPGGHRRLCRSDRVDEVPERFEKRVGVVVARIGGVETGTPGPVNSLAVGERARGIGRTVDAVGADARRDDESKRETSCRRRQGELLIPTAAARAPHTDRRLAARDDAERAPGTCRGGDVADMPPGRLTRVADKRRIEHHRYPIVPASASAAPLMVSRRLPITCVTAPARRDRPASVFPALARPAA